MYIIEERGESLELFDSSKSPELREATGELVIHAIGKGSLLGMREKSTQKAPKTGSI